MAVILTTAALSTLVVSCAKDFQDDIDDLNSKYTNIEKRVETLETQVKQINTDLQNLKVLSTAVEQGFYITEVKKTSYTYELTLSNGYKIVLNEGPNNTLIFAPSISMTLISGIYYWTVNGMLVIGPDGKPMPASTGVTPIVRYDVITQQWIISIDNGITFQNVTLFASFTINDEVLLQIINNYISKNSTTIISQDILFQIISTYIQENYQKVFNYEILNQVIVNYVDRHYTTIFDYTLLEQIFNQYNFEYAAQHIDVDIITNILIKFIEENRNIFVNNEVLYEIIKNYIEVNKIDIFSTEMIAEVINNYIQNNTNFISVELLTQIVANYIDQHKDVIINNEFLQNILIEFVQKNYLQIFSQDILYQVINNYITQNKTTIFNETIIREVINNYIQNNQTTIISETIIRQIINDYVTKNKTTIIDENILFEVISNYFKVNYNLFIDETIIKTIIKNHVEKHETEIIDIDIVRKIVNEYASKYYYEIFSETMLTEVISEYFKEHTEVIRRYVNEQSGVISSVDYNTGGDYIIIYLNNGTSVKLPVYDGRASVGDRVQSIVVVPNSQGYINMYHYDDFLTLKYIVSPAYMANVIQQRYSDYQMTIEPMLLSSGNVSTLQMQWGGVSADSDGTLIVMCNKPLYAGIVGTQTGKLLGASVALHIKDNADGGSDYMTSFTPIYLTYEY